LIYTIKWHAASDFPRLSADVLNRLQSLEVPAPAAVNHIVTCGSPVASPVQPAVQGWQPLTPSARKPAAPSNIASLDAITGSIHDPFRGKNWNVPQREDWIDARAESKYYVSIRKSEV
jgi:hypothetical protein